MTNSKAWNVNGAIATQSAAHARLENALANGSAVSIWKDNCRITTCASRTAALFWIGRAKGYTIKEA